MRRSLLRPLLARTEPTAETTDALTPLVANEEAFVDAQAAADGATSIAAGLPTPSNTDAAAPAAISIDIPGREGAAPGSSVASSWSDGRAAEAVADDVDEPSRESGQHNASPSDVVADDEEAHEEVGNAVVGAGETVGEGKLLVFVKGARGLAAVDRGGTSDPLAVVTVTGHKPGRKPETKRTKPVMKELNPDWNSPMLFLNVYDPSTEVSAASLRVLVLRECTLVLALISGARGHQRLRPFTKSRDVFAVRANGSTQFPPARPTFARRRQRARAGA